MKAESSIPSCKMYSTCCPVLAKDTRACRMENNMRKTERGEPTQTRCSGKSHPQAKDSRAAGSTQLISRAFSTSRPLAMPCASWPLSTSTHQEHVKLWVSLFRECSLPSEHRATSYLRIDTCKDRSRPIFGMAACEVQVPSLSNPEPND